VDQAPSQWAMPDWKHGSKGIYDSTTLAETEIALQEDFAAFADGMAEGCFSKPPTQDVVALIKSETLKCQPAHLARLMADHAPKDWRPILPRVSVPCLNLYGTDSGCFPVEGCQAVGELIGDNCSSVAFEGLNHWLYLEDPARFNQLVGDFVLREEAPRS
jgi:non-heme chloroperoxidase